MEQLTRKFPGFYRYAKILETLAAGIQSGAIPVPGRKEVPQQTEPATDYRQLAAAMDHRVRQLAEEGVPRSAIIERMTGYVIVSMKLDGRQKPRRWRRRAGGIEHGLVVAFQFGGSAEQRGTAAL